MAAYQPNLQDIKHKIRSVIWSYHRRVVEFFDLLLFSIASRPSLLSTFRYSLSRPPFKVKKCDSNINPNPLA